MMTYEELELINKEIVGRPVSIYGKYEGMSDLADGMVLGTISRIGCIGDIDGFCTGGILLVLNLGKRINVAITDKCRFCGKPLVDDGTADGCPCNSQRGINHGLVPNHVCTCIKCDPEQTGSARKPPGKIKFREFL